LIITGATAVLVATLLIGVCVSPPPKHDPQSLKGSSEVVEAAIAILENGSLWPKS